MSNVTVRKTGGLQAHQSPDEFGNLPMNTSNSIGNAFIRCDVGQPLSKAVKANKSLAGHLIFSNDTWKAQAKLEGVVFLKAHMNRVLYGATFDSAARCRSDDYKVPSPSIAEPVSESCLECPLGQWDNKLSDDQKEFKFKFAKELSPKKAGQPQPLCNETINVVFADARLTPFVMKFQKTALKIVNEQLINKLRYGVQGKKTYQMMFDVSLVELDSYYECKFDNFRENTQPEVYKELQTEVGLIAEAMLAQQHAQMDAEKEAAPVVDEQAPPKWEEAEELPF